MTHEVSCASYSHVGRRQENEDSVEIRRYGAETVVAVAADGLGGHGDGKAASALVSSLLVHLGAAGDLPDRESIAGAFRRVNAALIARQENMVHMKTTAVWLCVHRGRAVWAHVGDTRLYHVHDGKLEDYTLDHSSSQMAVYLGEITRDEIRGDLRRNLLLRAMGVEGDEPEIHDPIELAPGAHVFVLCSDGMWETMSDEEIVGACARADGAEAVVDALRALHDSRRAPKEGDDHTVAVVRLEVGRRA